LPTVAGTSMVAITSLIGIPFCRLGRARRFRPIIAWMDTASIIVSHPPVPHQSRGA
jgi:hypothetical protein